MAQLEALKGKVEEVIATNAKLAEFRQQIRLDITPDGLRIQIVDEQNRPMFDSGSAVVKRPAAAHAASTSGVTRRSGRWAMTATMPSAANRTLRRSPAMGAPRPEDKEGEVQLHESDPITRSCA